MEKLLGSVIKGHLEVINSLAGDAEFRNAIARFGAMAVGAFKSGNKMMICGNGGSAADSQHIAAELVGRFVKNRPAIGAIALTVDTSAITAIGNDFAFDSIFSRQVEGLGIKGDILLGITTSGNSPNVIKAMEKAREMGITTVGLSGANRAAKIAQCSDVCIFVPSPTTARVQEAHILIGHIVCEYIESNLFPA